MTLGRVLEYNLMLPVILISTFGLIVSWRQNKKKFVSRLFVPLITILLFKKDIHAPGLLTGPTIITLLLLAIDCAGCLERILMEKLSTKSEYLPSMVSILLISSAFAKLSAFDPKASSTDYHTMKQFEISNFPDRSIILMTNEQFDTLKFFQGLVLPKKTKNSSCFIL